MNEPDKIPVHVELIQIDYFSTSKKMAESLGAGVWGRLEEDVGSQLGLEGLCPGQGASGAEGGRSNTAKSGNLKVDRQRDKGMASGLVWDHRACAEKSSRNVSPGKVQLGKIDQGPARSLQAWGGAKGRPTLSGHVLVVFGLG